MKITRIIGRNIKGQSFDEALAPVTYFIGPNESGKTARADAVRLALIGYLPELGKTNAATFGLSSAREMSVDAHFDNGTVIRRRWWAEGNSVRAEHVVPEEFEKASGPLTILLNPSEYFGKTERERVDYVFANVRMGDAWTEQGIFERVDNAAGGTETQQALPVHLFEKGGTIQQYVERALQRTTEWGKASKDTAARMEKTIQGLSQLQALDDATIAGNLAALNERAASVQAEILRLTSEKGQLVGQYEAVTRAAKRREQIERTLASEGSKTARAREIRQTIADAENKLSQMPKRSTPEQLKAVTDKLDTARTTGERAKMQCEVVTKEIEAITRELSKLEQETTCPYCGACGDGWKAKKADELRARMADALTAQNSHSATLDRARADFLEAQEQVKAMTESDASRDAVEQLLKEKRNDLALAEQELAHLSQLREELANLPSPDPQLQARVETIQTALDAENDRARKIEREKADAIAQQSERKRLAEAQEARDAARADEKKAKAAANVLREIQGEMVAAAFGPLLETANAMFGGLMKTPLAFNAGEIGTWRGGTWVGHKTFSGAQKVMTYAAICAALAKDAPVRCVITDELKNLDDMNAVAVTVALVDAIKAGVLDNVVGTEPGRAAEYAMTEAQVVLLS